MISQQFLQLILASFIVAFISFVGFGAVAEKVQVTHSLSPYSCVCLGVRSASRHLWSGLL